MRDEFAVIAKERVRQLEWTLQTISNGQRRAFSSPITLDGQPYSLRGLWRTEIECMQSKGCSSSGWSNILLLLPSESESRDRSVLLRDLVSNTRFDGTVVLILSTESTARHSEIESYSKTLTKNWIDRMPRGIHDCTLVANSILHLDTVCVLRCGVVAHTHVQPGALVLNCGTIICTSQLCQVVDITVGPESGGGRRLLLSPEATMIDVGHQLVAPPKPLLQTKSRDGRAQLNIIGPHSVVRDTATLDTIYLHENCTIEGANSVVCALLFPKSSVRTGSTVSNVVVQWNGSVSQNSTVSDTLLMEQAAVGPMGLVTNTVLGPDVHVSAGEVHGSVLGPNCNAHHQSLLLAVLWPLGRGNVGYGANVGSNHTGRIPDQECSAGEGTFWGLSCVVKFPVDLSAAPYSIIAAGATLAPQRCTMPFSLIVSGSASSDQTATSIIPGWVLRHSPYTIVRSEHKFATRRQAVRHAHYTGWKILRPETLQLVCAARQALSSIDTIRPLYETDSAIPGIGMSQLSEAGRLGGIQAYTDCIQRFALEGLYDFLTAASPSERLGDSTLIGFLKREFADLLVSAPPPFAPPSKTTTVAWPDFPWERDQSSDAHWKVQRALLAQEFPLSVDDAERRHGRPLQSSEAVASWARMMLRRYLDLEKAFVGSVYKCKQRDDARGIATIPDYSEVHVLAEQDPVIASARTELREREAKVQALLTYLEAGAQSKL